MKFKLTIISFGLCVMFAFSQCASNNIKAANKAARKRYKSYKSNCKCYVETIYIPENYG